MTSSVSTDGDSPIVRLLDTKYADGTPVVKKLNWVQACLDCQRKNMADRCNHIARMFPVPLTSGQKLTRVGPPQHFQSYAGQERLARLMSHNSEAYDREMLNIGAKPLISAAFQRDWIDAMDATSYTLRKTVDHIFITVDPSATKNRNLYVLVSTIFVDGLQVVCFPFVARHTHPLRAHSSHSSTASSVICTTSRRPFRKP